MSQQRIDQLLGECHVLECDALKIALLEEAIRLADALNDPSRSFSIRTQLVQTATFGGYKEKALVAFAWCLAEFDRNPEICSSWEILWRYKWILGSLTDYPNISREQIVSMQDDFQRRLQELNFGLGPIHHLRWKNFMNMGEMELALEHYLLWQASSGDVLGDCNACVASSETSLMIHLKRNEQALAIAQPILDGKLSCATVPQNTYGRVLRVYLRLDRLDEAEEILRKAHRPLSKSPNYLDGIAEMQLYLIRQRRLIKAINTLEKSLPWVMGTADLDARYKFYWTAALLMQALSEKGKSTRKFKFPEKFPRYREDSHYDLAELAAWFEQQTKEIVAAFNQRNGNDYCTKMIEESRELARV